jgi:YHS domain-containing protein
MSIPLVFLFAFTFSINATAQHESQGKGFNLEKGLAIKGYDPVAYFTQSRAVKGLEQLSYTHKGVKYYFSSEANRKTFVANPEAYQPQYGGWCAFAMGDTGEKVEIDPKTFKITNGKLYLFYNFYFTNTLTPWIKNEVNLIKKADQNWGNQSK